MLITSYGTEFSADAGTAAPAVPADTPLGATAAEMLEMIRCYASDGIVFQRQGDYVNAVASFSYGYGWLDAGVFLGYLRVLSALELPVITETLPDALQDHLNEKTHRYQWMLSAARDGVFVIPDVGTRMYSAAQSIWTTAAAKCDEGSERSRAGDLMNALVSFSYGYGWLDAGVRAGLFGITGDRHLFTI